MTLIPLSASIGPDSGALGRNFRGKLQGRLDLDRGARSRRGFGPPEIAGVVPGEVNIN